MATRPATNPLILDAGVTIAAADGYDVKPLMTTGVASLKSNSALPPGVLVSGSIVYGTPTTAGTTETWWAGGWDDAAERTESKTIFMEVVEAAPEPVTAEPPVFNDEDYTVTIPAVAGVAYLIGGTYTPAGTVSAAPGTTVTVTAEPADAGYALEGEAEWSHDFPPAGPDEPDYAALLTEDPEAVTVRNALAPRVIIHAGAVATTEATALASAHVGVVLEYVNGYTRGRGFHGMIPERDLQAVIVASAARLFTNPEQVSSYTLGDYSERPAILAGWTLAEMAVLRRHRVTVR